MERHYQYSVDEGENSMASRQVGDDDFIEDEESKNLMFVKIIVVGKEDSFHF